MQKKKDEDTQQQSFPLQRGILQFRRRSRKKQRRSESVLNVYLDFRQCSAHSGHLPSSEIGAGLSRIKRVGWSAQILALGSILKIGFLKWKSSFSEGNLGGNE